MLSSMINKLSILLSTIGMGVCVFSLFASDYLAFFGFISILASAAIFILNWKNGWKSVLVAVYLMVIFGTLYLGHRFVMFEGWFMMATLFFIPLLSLLLGCMLTTGAFVEKFKECLAYILCIVSIWIGIFLFIFFLSAGV